MEAVHSVTTLHLSQAQLQAGLDHITQAPKNNGVVDSIVIRPQENERIVLATCELSPQLGVHGDGWSNQRSPNAKAQMTLMNSRAIALIAGTTERWALAGDQLYVDLDLSDDNMKPGQRLSVGSAVLEVTDKPHLGCAKFASRFGNEALEFVNSTQGRCLRLRGMYVIVVEAGMVKVGDSIVKVSE